MLLTRQAALSVGVDPAGTVSDLCMDTSPREGLPDLPGQAPISIPVSDPGVTFQVRTAPPRLLRGGDVVLRFRPTATSFPQASRRGRRLHLSRSQKAVCPVDSTLPVHTDVLAVLNPPHTCYRGVFCGHTDVNLGSSSSPLSVSLLTHREPLGTKLLGEPYAPAIATPLPEKGCTPLQPEGCPTASRAVSTPPAVLPALQSDTPWIFNALFPLDPKPGRQEMQTQGFFLLLAHSPERLVI